MYPDDTHSDLPREQALAELVREKALSGRTTRCRTRSRCRWRRWRSAQDLVTVRALLWVETESQKGILSARVAA